MAYKIRPENRNSVISAMYDYESEIAGTLRALLTPQILVASVIAASYVQTKVALNQWTGALLLFSTLLIALSLLLSGISLTRTRPELPIVALDEKDFDQAFADELREVRLASLLRRIVYYSLVFGALGGLAVASRALSG